MAGRKYTAKELQALRASSKHGDAKTIRIWTWQLRLLLHYAHVGALAEGSNKETMTTIADMDKLDNMGLLNEYDK